MTPIFKIVSLFILSFLFIKSLFCQCPTNSVTFKSQSQINDFVTQYSNCADIPISLGFKCKSLIDNSGFFDVSGMKFIRSIKGSLTIDYEISIHPDNFEGFNNLEEIGGDLNFQLNTNTFDADFSVFSKLEKIGGSLIMNTNSSTVHSMAGFSTKLTIGENVIFSRCNLGPSPGFQGFHVDSIYGSLEISQSSIDTLKKFTANYIGKDLVIQNIQNLKDCQGLCYFIKNNIVHGEILLSENNDVCNDLNKVSQDCGLDKDGDGFTGFEDCDDYNAAIHPDAIEIVNNYIDDNCDGIEWFIDEDMDGYNSDEDCDDNNPNVNPGAFEILNNYIDDDCDGYAYEIDDDMDGFNSSDDCNDYNPSIFPGAIEIPNNDIDEDCDGADLISSSSHLIKSQIFSFPNPVRNTLYIDKQNISIVSFQLTNLKAEIILDSPISNNSQIEMSAISKGVYILILFLENGERHYLKIIKL